MLQRSYLFNLILILLFSAGLLLLFFNSLNWLTNHGKQTFVPSLMGKHLDIALKELKKMGFRIQIDSTYKSYKAPLEVLFQEPEAGASVKVGRTIFLTINRKTPPSIEMPNLVNKSFRNAILIMKSYNLEMGDTTYRPDVAAGAVLEQWYKGKQIMAGSMIPFGAKVDLVIGEGLSGEQDVPNLIGMRWDEAQNLLAPLSLSLNAVWEGKIADSAAAIIYMQQPEALNELDFKNAIPEGDIIDVRIMQSPSAELLQKNQPGSKKLIGEESLVDSNEMPIDHENAVHRKEIPDSLKKKRMVPGMQSRSSEVEDKSADKKNKKLDNTKSKEKTVGKEVNTKNASKKASDVKKATPPKSNDNSFSNEFD
jgi:beta-lactam-binding protein with PASTA domain